jgi:dimethylhistidine N-methyltransferase
MTRAPRYAEPGTDAAQFAADVRESLARRPRQLPSRYFYDALGSALFDAICELPWYRITRAESRLLAAHRTELLRRLEGLSTIVELGPGNGEKLKLLLQDVAPAGAPLEVHLVDVSSRALETAVQAVSTRRGIRIVTHATEYDAGLREVSSLVRRRGSTLVLFLGSNIGNFDAPGAAAFLETIRENVTPGDALLLGTDLIKPERELVLAYDDPLGVTAAFNRNLLVRINSELGGNFAVEQFGHQAVWNAAQSRMEMFLVARTTQHVRIAALPMEFTLAAGERIWTETSHKYRAAGVSQMLEAAGFRTAKQWIDDRDAFALTLAYVKPEQL